MDENNPPAFPRDHRHLGHNGMSLRDYFAGQALAGLLASITRTATGHANVDGSGMVADCYKLADAMLAERTVVGRA